MKANKTIQRIDQQIQEIKNQLLTMGEMRPGSLTQQYNVCGKAGCRCKDPDHPRRHGPYYQLSYVQGGKSTSRFIRPHLLPQVKTQLASYKKFRRLTERWIALAMQKAEWQLKTSRQEPDSRRASEENCPKS